LKLKDIFLNLIKKKLYQYLKQKYGEACVAPIATFSELRGRSALKEICRIHEIDFETSNMLTAKLPKEAKLDVELEELVEDVDEDDEVGSSVLEEELLESMLLLELVELEEFEDAYFYAMKNYIVRENNECIIHGSSLKSSRACGVVDRAVQLAIQHIFNNNYGKQRRYLNT
jgi:hypothetical protein